ncbi:MAG TPA: protein kinase [Pyrinomonadaceae bacterium]|nr:protein kinase [Pyrinomonadaceae bacterium]
MTPERWRHIKEVFHGALARPPAERASFIDSACAGDEAARREVSQLISAHEEAGEFLDTPAFEVMAESLAGPEPAGLAPGQSLGRYRVIGSLGAGGMGEVYLAEDTDLGRKVALKLLPASFTAETDRVLRFEREARAASSPNHPNVCTIHEVAEAEDGRRYIVMEHVEAVTLRRHMSGRRMEVAEMLDVAIQIASGLAAAHAAGVVHRDIKPENVMLRPDGIVKVLDFGLAKLTGRQPFAGSATPSQPGARTEAGVVLGTAAYMSPEQARGLEVDARTDVWSLGVVLYEMAAGRAPFAGETPSHVIVSILESEPPALPLDEEVPAELWRVISKALRKDKAERYQTARDMALDLKGLKEELEVAARLKRELRPNSGGKELDANGGGFGAADYAREPAARTGHVVPARPTGSVGYLAGKVNRRKPFAAAALLVLLVAAVGLTYLASSRNKADSGGAGKKSIAVLPLKPISAGARDEIYEVGIADSLIHRLSAVKGLMVRPLSATRKYAGIEQDPLAAGREQQADYVLASNYQLAAGKIRITAQLLHVASGQVEETYKSEKDAGDLFAMQDAVADEVGNLFLARFATGSSSPKAVRGTTNEEAYRLYLQGMYLVEKENRADSKRALELFDQALSLDPNYAKAWAGKARAHCLFAHTGGSTPDAEFATAKPALERAFALDNNLPEAHAVLGIIKNDYDWNFVEGEKHFLRAIELAPNSDIFYRWYAHKLSMQGRSDEALALSKTAIDLNPNYVVHQIWYGHALYYARRYDDAVTQLERVVEMDSTRAYAHSVLWRSYHLKGDHPRAYKALMKLLQLIGTKDETLKNYEALYAKSGWQSVLLRNLESLKANDANGSAAYLIAQLSALSGQREQSLLHLNDAVKNRSLETPNLLGDPALDSLRGDPRFAELVERVESLRR